MTFKKPKASELKIVEVATVTPTDADASAESSVAHKQAKNHKKFSQKRSGAARFFMDEEILSEHQQRSSLAVECDSDEEETDTYSPK